MYYLELNTSRGNFRGGCGCNALFSLHAACACLQSHARTPCQSRTPPSCVARLALRATACRRRRRRRNAHPDCCFPPLVPTSPFLRRLHARAHRHASTHRIHAQTGLTSLPPKISSVRLRSSPPQRLHLPLTGLTPPNRLAYRLRGRCPRHGHVDGTRHDYRHNRGRRRSRYRVQGPEGLLRRRPLDRLP